MNAPQPKSQFYLSPTHEVLAGIERLLTADPANAIVNHPDVRPHVGGKPGRLDCSPIIQNTQNVVLHCRGFLAICNLLSPGLYEVHTQALPDARGAHTFQAAVAMLHWMFTKTTAIELVTRIPDHNVPALTLARSTGFRLEFRRPTGWATATGEQLPVDWYRLGITDWMSTADGLVERGQWFHNEIEAACARAEVTREDHPDDTNHDRFVGAACEMILGGQPVKGIHFINRYSAIVGNPPVVLLNDSPLVVHIGDVAVRIDGDRLEIVKSQ